VVENTQSPTSLRHYAQILWRRKWIVVEAAVIVPAIVLVISFLQPTLYTSVTRIMAVSQSPSLSVVVGTNIDLSKPDERELQTLASFVVTPEIAQRAGAQLGWSDAPATLMAGVSAEADANADIIAVSAKRSDPQKAAQLANAFAGQFVEWRKETQQRSFDEAVQLVDEQIAAAKPGSTERQSLIDRRSQLDVYKALVTGGLTIGEVAQPSSSPSSPKPLRNGALAVLAGLVLGVGFAFVRESLDVKLHSADEIAEATTLPVIAAVPKSRKNEKSSDNLAVLEDPRGPAAEAYRFLRTNLQFVDLNNDVKVVMVTSPLPQQGKSTTIANLAIALLRAGKKVAVVEGDLRRPSLHRFFKIANARGVTNVVAGTSSLDDAAQVLTFHDPGPAVTTPKGRRAVKPVAGEARAPGDLELKVLSSGPLPPNPGEIVGSRQLGAMLDTLRAESDYVLVDAPPMFAVGDAATLAARVDGIIVILRLDQTTADTIKDVEDFFTRVPARPLGVVITGVADDAKGKYHRYQEYYD
jgi:Mrp family chromosome partitioning ATPase/capsular polysaccharide biosynthesis protein